MDVEAWLEGLTDSRACPTAAVQALGQEPAFMLRVFGRLPVSDVTRCSEAGVRKASGRGNRGGEFAPAVVSVHGELACVCPDLWISTEDHGRRISSVTRSGMPSTVREVCGLIS